MSAEETCGGGASEKVPLVVQDEEQCAKCVLFVGGFSLPLTT